MPLRIPSLALSTLFFCSCVSQAPPAPSAHASYFDNTGRDDVSSGGVRTIAIGTPKGRFQVWTKRVGNNLGLT